MEYIDAFYSGLINILPFTGHGQQAFLFMLVGIFIGFWVGILPGMGGAATLALMLPFMYKMDPTSALLFSWGPTPSPLRLEILPQSFLASREKARRLPP